MVSNLKVPIQKSVKKIFGGERQERGGGAEGGEGERRERGRTERERRETGRRGGRVGEYTP